MAKKLPVWIKHKGKYEPIPYHLMHTFADGKRGFYCYETWQPHTEPISQFYLRHSKYFEYQDTGTNSRLIFLGYKRRSWIDLGHIGAITICTVTTCINWMMGDLWLAALTVACFAISVFGLLYCRHRNHF